MGLTLVILVSIIVISGIIYISVRYSAALAERRKKEEVERLKRDKEDKEKSERKKTELKMHQEEVIVMAKSNPETVARIVKNWLT